MAGEYIWEKTGKALSPIKNHTPKYMTILGYKVPHYSDPAFYGYLKGFVLRRLGLRKKGKKPKTITLTNANNMNPIDYWFLTNPRLQEFISSFWEENSIRIPYPSLYDDMKTLMKEEAIYDRLQCLSVLSAIKLILS